MAIQQIFTDLLPLDVSLSQLPSLIRIGARTLQLEANAVRTSDGQLKNLLLTLQDVTELRRRQRESRRNRILIGILHDIEAFRVFMGGSYEIIQRLRRSQDLQDIRFLLHTLKGNCLVFKLSSIARSIHQLEDLENFDAGHADRLEGLFIKFLMTFKDILNTQWGPYSPEIRLESGQVEKLEHMLAGMSPGDIQKQLSEWILAAKAVPVGPILKPILESSRITARRLKKNIRIEVQGSHVRLNSQAEIDLVELLNHVVKNAVVHGIEPNRQDVGKVPEGRIDITFKESQDSLLIICEDDGKGFDREYWESAALKKLRVDAEMVRRMSLADLISRVIQGGHSTASKVSLDAGRGVGLDGFFSAVEARGGRLEIISNLGRGTRFEMTLPRRSTLALSRAS